MQELRNPRWLVSEAIRLIEECDKKMHNYSFHSAIMYLQHGLKWMDDEKIKEALTHDNRT